MLLTAAVAGARAQLTVEECRRMARANYPAICKYGLIEKAAQLQAANAAKGYLPQLAVSGTAAAFTDPAELPPTMGGIDNSLYNIGITLSQTIYDGGAISAARQDARAKAEVESRAVDVTLYDIEGRVDDLFFGIAAIDASHDGLLLLERDLNIGMASVQAMVKNGTANRTDADRVSVELLKLKQSKARLEAARKATVGMMSLLTGKQWPANVALALPAAATHTPTTTATAETAAWGARPEMLMLDAKARRLDTRRRQIDTRLMPTIGAFGTLAWHNRPADLLKNSMLAAGLSLTWNIGALYTRKNDLQAIELERSAIEADRRAFAVNTAVSAVQTDGRIDDLTRQIKIDEEIVRLREDIKEKTRRKVEMGTDTVNELLRAINDVDRARQEMAARQVELARMKEERKRMEGGL